MERRTKRYWKERQHVVFIASHQLGIIKTPVGRQGSSPCHWSDTFQNRLFRCHSVMTTGRLYLEDIYNYFYCISSVCYSVCKNLHLDPDGTDICPPSMEYICVYTLYSKVFLSTSSMVHTQAVHSKE
jgi:hypothetical protein